MGWCRRRASGQRRRERLAGPLRGLASSLESLHKLVVDTRTGHWPTNLNPALVLQNTMHARLYRSVNALLGALLCAATPAGSAWAATPDTPDPPQVTLQVRLFYSRSGNFSGDVLQAGGTPLINIVAAADPSTASLVTVVLTLPPQAVLRSDARVRLRAREQLANGSSRTLIDRTLSVGAVTKGSVAHFGFWLQGTGCRPVQLKAKLMLPGQATTPGATAMLPFACGE